MNKKSVVNGVIIGVVALGLCAGFVYTRGTKAATCEKVLREYSTKSVCVLTNKGTMVFELYTDAAPKSIERLEKLSNQDKFYDNLEFYRLLPYYL